MKERIEVYEPKQQIGCGCPRVVLWAQKERVKVWHRPACTALKEERAA